MPTNTVTPNGLSTVVSAGASPVTLTIPPHSDPLVLVLTSASAITVTGQSTSRPNDVQHTP